jgi:hypothetical protein
MQRSATLSSVERRSSSYSAQDDSGMMDWNNRFAQGQAKVERGSYMRIAVARVSPDDVASEVGR